MYVTSELVINGPGVVCSTGQMSVNICGTQTPNQTPSITILGNSTKQIQYSSGSTLFAAFDTNGLFLKDNYSIIVGQLTITHSGTTNSITYHNNFTLGIIGNSSVITCTPTSVTFPSLRCTTATLSNLSFTNLTLSSELPSSIITQINTIINNNISLGSTCNVDADLCKTSLTCVSGKCSPKPPTNLQLSSIQNDGTNYYNILFTPSTTPGTATYTVTSEPVGITGSGTSPIRLNVSHLSNSYTIYVTATINGVTSKAASITTSNYSWPNPNFLNLFPKSERTINLVINPNVLNEFLRFTSEWTNMKSACSGTTCNSGVSFLNVDCSFFRLSIYNNTDDTDNNLIHYGEHSNSNNFKFPSNSTKIIIKIFLDHNRGLTTLNSAYVNTNGDVQFLYSSGNPSSGVTILGFFFQTYISLIFDTVNKSVTSYIETRFDINFSLFGWFRTMLYDGILKNTSTGFPFFGGRVNMNNPPYPAHMTDYNKTLNNYITISST